MNKLGKQFITFTLTAVILLMGVTCSAQSQYSGTISKMETSLFGLDYPNQSDDARLKRIEGVVYGKSSTTTIPQRVSKLTQDLSADLIGQEIKPKKDTFAQDDESGYKEPIPKADSSVNYPTVNQLELAVFNKEFKTLDVNERLAKLEAQVFKKAFSDDLNSRVDRLKQAVMPETIAMKNVDDADEITTDYYGSDGSVTQIPQSAFDSGLMPNRNSIFSRNGSQTPQYNRNNSVLDNYQPDADLAIPLAELERVILKKSYPEDTASNRLARLEMSIFNSTFADDDEQTRLDRIASAYQAKKSSKKYDGNKFAQRSATAMQVGAILLMILAAIL